MKDYDHKKIEEKWRQKWSEGNIYRSTEDTQKPKSYVLDMFPYPSGEGLHVGHPKGYIATDIYSRYKRMSGHNVLHPMGWDAFGLPAENYAIKNKIHPRIAVEENVSRFKEQLGNLGLDYDWDREINTTDPEYYKWTQWIFLKLHEKGLAYQSNEPINWCPSCQTGLANEDLEDGKCERCGSEVEKRPIRQWVLRITDYADRLLRELETLDKWPEHIREMQRNWIGRKEGAEIKFKVQSPKFEVEIPIFTTRPDTLFGATYLVISPEHNVIEKLKTSIENWKEVEEYINKAKKKTEIERTAEGKTKTGVELKGVKALNPATGEEIPVWVADYVLGSYGTGTIMAVPAHDERDFEFARHYNLPIRSVVMPRIEAEANADLRGIGAIIKTSTGKYLLQKRDMDAEWNPGAIAPFGGAIDNEEDVLGALIRELTEELGLNVGDCGVRFIGTKKSHIDPDVSIALFLIEGVETADLMLGEGDEMLEMKMEDALENSNVTEFTKEVLRSLESSANIVYTGEGPLLHSGEFNGTASEEAREKIIQRFGEKKVNYRLQDWVFSRQRYWGEPIPLIHCAKCGVVPVPEKDLPVLLPQVENYEPSGTGESPLANIDDWVNVVCPKCTGAGKRETNTMPQWAGSCWYYLRFMDPANTSELVDANKEKYWSPVDLYVGGAEHATRHLIYARFWHKFLYDIGVVSTLEPFTELHSVGLILAEDGRKMSKRWGNVINPDDIVERLGADTLRVYEMFMGPFENAIAWNTDSMVGARRFLERVMGIAEEVQEEVELELEEELHKTIKKTGQDIEQFKFNTAISQMMIFINLVEKVGKIGKGQLSMFLKVLAPFAPHLAEELWNQSGEDYSIHLSTWPEYDEEKLRRDTVTIAVQVNGKVRDEVKVPLNISKEELEKKVLGLPSVIKWTEGKTIQRTIYVSGKLINIVA